MAVDPKPNDPSLNDLTWAESNNKPAAEGSDLPEKPSDEFLADGYGNRNVLPHAQFNWLIRSMMRWIRWLVSKVDGHVHDGGTSAGSVAKVNANDHLDWGTGGFLTVTTASNVHIITHGGTANTRRIVAQQLQASTIRSVGQGETASVTIRDSGGSNGFLNSPILQTDTIRRNAPGAGAINVRASDGANSTTLNVATLQTGTIQRNAAGAGTINVRDSNNSNNITLNVSRIQSNDRILMEDQANSSNVLINGSFVNFSDSSGDAFIGLNNTPKYIARITADGTAAYSFLATGGNVTITRTVQESTTGAGEYTFTFPFTTTVAIITLRNNRGFVSYNRFSDNQIRVITTNTSNNFTNQDFAIVVF
jgi:hypothetical protein